MADFSLKAGVTAGLKTVWQEGLLTDLTLRVEGQTFSVHRALLAAVSGYFHDVLTREAADRAAEEVELKGLDADAVAKMIELIYSGDAEIIATHAADIHLCAVYLKMPLVTEACVKRLMEDLNVNNCGSVLYTVMVYSTHDELQKVKDFIKANFKKVLEEHKMRNMPKEVLQVFIDFWQENEYQLFLFIKYWLYVEEQKVYVDEFMTQVRFGILTPGEISAIKEMDIFTDCRGSWCDLVVEAGQYHKLPAHQRVLHTSVQTQVRRPPAPVLFTAGQWVSLDNFYVLEGDDWTQYEARETPDLPQTVPIYIAVNNFLVICTEYDEPHACDEDSLKQEWYMFDMRSKTWSKMANMLIRKTGFPLLHHGDSLYALGGHRGMSYSIGFGTIDSERYDFSSNTWCQLQDLPEGVTDHSACVFGDYIYISGGVRPNQDPFTERSDKMECLDILSGTWELKAPMSKGRCGHTMHKMTIFNTDVILMIDDSFKFEYYTPGTNQWTSTTFVFNRKRTYSNLEWGCEGLTLSSGNSVFFINITGEDDSDPDDNHSDDFHNYEDWGDGPAGEYVCAKWEFPQEGLFLKEICLPQFPVQAKFWEPGVMDEPGVAPYGAVLSVPY